MIHFSCEENRDKEEFRSAGQVAPNIKKDYIKFHFEISLTL